MPDAAQALSVRIEEFRGERTAAHAGAVGLEDAEHLAYAGGRHAQTRAHAGGKGIGGRHERIGAEIDVQQGALRAFGQDGDAVVQRRVHIDLAVDEGEALEGFHRRLPLLLIRGDVVGEIVLGEQAEMLLFQRFVLVFEGRGEDVPHAEAVAAGLVHVGGADALEGGADLGLPLGGFAGGVQHPVRRQDEVCTLGDDQLAGDGARDLLDGGDLFHKDHRVDDHPVADHIDRPLPEDPGGNRVQHETVPVEDQGMSRVGTALEAGDHLVTGCEHIHDLAFALVPPLEAEHYVQTILFHIENGVTGSHSRGHRPH